jgi:hypothetical protein
MIKELIEKTDSVKIQESIYLDDLGRPGVEEIGRATLKGDGGEVIMLATLKTYTHGDVIDTITAQITGNARGSGGQDRNGWIMFYESLEGEEDMDEARKKLRSMIESFKLEISVK